NTVLPTTTAPGPSIEPPWALTPLTVGYSCFVLISQRILPVAEAYARRCPSSPPEKTTPGIAVTAADCAGVQPGTSPQPGCGVDHRTLPVRGSHPGASPLVLIKLREPPSSRGWFPAEHTGVRGQSPGAFDRAGASLEPLE